GVLYGAIVAIGQADMKRLIAYTSISHFGFIVLGIFVLTSQGQSGATLYMVNHGFATGALFLIAGFMIVRRRSSRIADYGGVQKVAPGLAGLFLISGLAGLALPGLSTFVSEFLVLAGTFTRYKGAASFATVGIILAAIYILWMYQRTMTGPVREQVARMPDLKARELWAVGPLIALIIAFGVYPQPLLVFCLAVAGVLVEAFVPRAQRRALHLVLTLGGLAAAFVLVIVIAAGSSLFANGRPGHLVAVGGVAVDGPTLFIWGTILVLAFVSVLLIAESSHDVSPFAAQAATIPGSAEEREGLLAGITHTEVYPLTLFAVGGMLLFPASNDLLTMFVALEVLSLPLYLLCGMARRRRLLSQEAAMKYFLLGAFSSA